MRYFDEQKVEVLKIGNKATDIGLITVLSQKAYLNAQHINNTYRPLHLFNRTSVR